MGEVGRAISKALGSRGNASVKLALAVFLFIILYFFHFGITTTPKILNELDSINYHIPMAQNFSNGRFIDQTNVQQGLGFYPGIGEMILAPFVKLGIPLNLYNLAGLIVLFFSCYFLAKIFKLSSDSGIVFAVSVCLLPTIIRLIPFQTNDIWLAVFFIWSLIFLSKSKRQNSHFAKLGISLGLLIGVKYSGILYAVALLFVFRKKLWARISFSRLISFLIPVIIFGVSWYIRNYFVTGNPFYPVYIFGFVGHPKYSSQNWITLTTLFTLSDSLVLLQGFISEYLVWIFSPIIVSLFLLRAKQKNLLQKSSRILSSSKDVVISSSKADCRVSFSKLRIPRNDMESVVSSFALLAVINFIIWLPQPHGAGIQLAASNWRLTYPAMIPLMLSTFILAKKYLVQNKIYLIALACSLSVLPQLQYRPKLVLIWLVTMIIILFKSKLRKFCL
jgi:hypothetical protein